MNKTPEWKTCSKCCGETPDWVIDKDTGKILCDNCNLDKKIYDENQKSKKMRCFVCGSTDRVRDVTGFGLLCYKHRNGSEYPNDIDLNALETKRSLVDWLFVLLLIFGVLIFIIPFIYCVIEDWIQDRRSKSCATIIVISK